MTMLKIGETVEFKRDGLYGVGVVTELLPFTEEYQAFVRVIEIKNYSSAVDANIADIWGIDVCDLVNSDEQTILRALELVRETSVESNCPAKARAVVALLEVLDEILKKTESGTIKRI